MIQTCIVYLGFTSYFVKKKDWISFSQLDNWMSYSLTINSKEWFNIRSLN